MKPLGRGHYGVVRRCVSIETGQEYAIKTIRKARVSRVESLLREVQILRKVSHPNIIELVDAYEDEMNLHLVSRGRQARRSDRAVAVVVGHGRTGGGWAG